MHDVSEENEDTVWVSTNTFGSLINGATFNADTDPDVNSASLTVGGHDSSHTFHGLIDEVVFFNGTALTAIDAEAIFDGDWR